MTDNRPYWFPVLCDESYFARLRQDYPENAQMSDEELHEYYNDGLRYQNLWDHAGDAYSDYEPLADSYLQVLAALRKTLSFLENTEGELGITLDSAEEARSAIAVADGAKE